MDTRRSAAGALVFTLGSLGCSGAVEAPPPGAGPAAPTELVVTPLTGGGHLVWKDNASDEDGFEIERKSSGEFQRIASVVFDIRQYHDGDVTAGVSYAYRVRATNAAGNSAYSNVATLVLPGPGGDAGLMQEDAQPADDAAPAQDDASVDAGAPDAAARVVSFQADIVPILAQSCGSGDNGCHSRVAYLGDRAQDCRGWLALENVALGSRHPNTNAPTGCPDRTLHERLVGLNAWMCEPQRRYVVPGSTADSQVHSVISGRSGMNGTCNRAPGMPLGPMPPPTSLYRLPAASAQLIADWIEAGAPNN
jgi:hypothetical protein